MVSVGEIVIVGRIRWQVRAMNRKTRVVRLCAMNAMTPVWWTTTLDNLRNHGDRTET